ncbi:MAG: carbonic anhydrase [Candidatus Acidiferrales bacterium]
MILSAFSAAALFCAPASLPQEHSSKAPHWSYSGAMGPEHWGDLDPGFAACKTGTRQSPINIEGAREADLPPIHFDYKLSPLRIVNNGHTIQVNYDRGSAISIAGKQYTLVQFHFHHPSEEEIGGKRFDMVAHLVHQDPQGRYLVVAVLFKSGGVNPFIHVLWTNLPKEAGKELTVKKVVLNAEDILPSDQNYYRFEGSLTTPPCSEGVTWYVLKTPVEISSEQIAVFAKMFPNNARPIQPANGREILESHFP